MLLFFNIKPHVPVREGEGTPIGLSLLLTSAGAPVAQLWTGQPKPFAGPWTPLGKPFEDVWVSEPKPVTQQFIRRWDDMTMTWDEALMTWDDSGEIIEFWTPIDKN